MSEDASRKRAGTRHERSEVTAFPRADEREFVASAVKQRTCPREQRPEDGSKYGN
ncbi:hypothetical protein GL213_07490 [Halogeometricum borinquense]|uniref:Uncharacterized protein n=1 Tax=Halogeometricum borinquense (strain ATCC 700274 / DSM 11551 / JCM 10706 / KCTC 4070 / PR3) TaxID=469382 RepID=E4NTM4_HALBP|nr:hypothetical protein [Halogeometricum borinquense]ADQ67076.1 hypothetical protein Hbor_15030 [Halogeometricum borinquense DSM 11551]ELY29622.1 hypothetical protein C499_04938 [Halogeometricum borinquense DSM 11551]QIQ76371.1 hypothetical protein GL213_07490 [Halogeometricum borinquense]